MGHRALVINFGSAPKSGVSTRKYGQPSYCPALNTKLDVLPHSFLLKKVYSSKIYFGGPQMKALPASSLPASAYSLFV